MRPAPRRPFAINLKPASANPSRRSKRTNTAAIAGPNIPMDTRIVKGTPMARRMIQIDQLMPNVRTMYKTTLVQFIATAELFFSFEPGVGMSVSIYFFPHLKSNEVSGIPSCCLLISNPFKECLFGDTLNPGRGLAALCTSALHHHYSTGFDMKYKT